MGLFDMFKSTSSSPYSEFEKACVRSYGKTPQEMIEQKIKSGSNTKSIRYMYESTTDEVTWKSGTTAPSFDYYYERLSDANKRLLMEADKRPELKLKNENAKYLYRNEFGGCNDYRTSDDEWSSTKPKVDSDANSSKLTYNTFFSPIDPKKKKGVCLREVTHAGSFESHYVQGLDAIFADKECLGGIIDIASRYENIELCETSLQPEFKTFKMVTLPDEFKKTGLLDREPIRNLINQMKQNGLNEVAAIRLVYYAARHRMM